MSTPSNGILTVLLAMSVCNHIDIGTKIFGADRDANSIEKARHHATTANVDISFTHTDIRDVQPPTITGLIITNPPYGIKSGRNTNAVYHWFGQRLRSHFQQWRVLFLSPNEHKASLVHPKAQRITHFSNGGIMVGVYAWDPLA